MRRLIGFMFAACVLVLFVPSVTALAQSSARLCITVEMTNGQPAPSDPQSLIAAIANSSATITSWDAPSACADSVQAQPTPGPLATPQLIHGTGSGQSESFYLAPGDYVVAWAGFPASGSDCLASLSVENSGGEFFHGRIANETVSDSSIRNNNIHGVPGGLYYIEAIADCGWAVAFAHV
jgi:hypothetical protein